MDGLLQAFQRCLDSIMKKDQQETAVSASEQEVQPQPVPEFVVDDAERGEMTTSPRNDWIRSFARTVAGEAMASPEPLLRVALAGEVWDGQGLSDIDMLLLTDEDGDEAHEFILIDPPPRCGHDVQSERGPMPHQSQLLTPVTCVDASTP